MIFATLCYIINNDEILMLYRNKKENDVHQGKFNGLGGKLEIGESPDECVVREIKEESGLILQSYRCCGVMNFPLFDGKNDWLVYLYTASKFSGEIIVSAEGDLHWIKISELDKINLWEGDRFFMKWMFEGKFFSAKFNYFNKKLIDYDVEFYDETNWNIYLKNQTNSL